MSHIQTSSEQIENPSVFDLNTVSFDPGDRSNGSLYICDPIENPSGIMLDEVVAEMRKAAIWSGQDARQVPEEQKEQYKTELVLEEIVTYLAQNGKFTLARFNHPKYPSDEVRWANWLKHFDGKFERLERPST